MIFRENWSQKLNDVDATSVVGDSVRARVGVTLFGVTLLELFVTCDELFDKMLPETVLGPVQTYACQFAPL